MKGGTQIRTGEWKLCRLLPYHLAMPPDSDARLGRGLIAHSTKLEQQKIQIVQIGRPILHNPP